MKLYAYFKQALLKLIHFTNWSLWSRTSVIRCSIDLVIATVGDTPHCTLDACLIVSNQLPHMILGDPPLFPS